MELGSIRPAIERLRAASPQPDVFGAKLHRFILNPPLPESEVGAFKVKHRISLPWGYRRFVVEVGNGGAGPHYGLFRLGETMDMRSLVQWKEDDGVIGVLSRPFSHTGQWNDLTGQPTEDDEEDPEYDEKMQAFYERYFSSQYLDGAIPISDLGCALKHWLVVTGPEAGHVWCDFRSDYQGILPLVIADQQRVTFLDWYSAWLEEALRKLGR